MTAAGQPDGRSDTPALARAEWDRSAAERDVEDILHITRADPRTRVLVIHGDAGPLESADALCWRAPADAPDAAIWAFLGRDEAGAAVLAAVLPAEADEPFPAPAGWAGLRLVGDRLSAAEVGVFVEALSLGRWLLDSAFCPFCGTRTELRQAGWSRRCPHCGREHFPRTDPAVIVAVGSADDSRILLGSNLLWGADRYSTFAGFGEAGESLEATVQREIREESGVSVDSIRYFGSQAWPYPRSLMVGFHARAVDDAAARADGEEIVAVRWFTRAEIGAALAGASEVTLPGPVSIAHSLITAWYARGVA